MRSAVLFVVAAAVLVASVNACGKWVASTAFEPVPDDAFRSEWKGYPTPTSHQYFCSCQNQTGSLWNDDAGYGPGWKCWIGRSTYCGVSNYHVLVADFPSSTGPSIVNSTETRPVPKGSLPGFGAPNDFSCVQYLKIYNDYTVAPGSLTISSTGNYVCRSVSPNGYYNQRQVVDAGPGKFAAVVANKC